MRSFFTRRFSNASHPGMGLDPLAELGEHVYGQYQRTTGDAPEVAIEATAVKFEA